MYLIIFTTNNDNEDYIDRPNNIEYRLCSTQEKADQLAIDLLYNNVKNYFNEKGGHILLNNRGYYSMNNVNDLLTLIKTNWVKHKFIFTIKELKTESYIKRGLKYKLS